MTFPKVVVCDAQNYMPSIVPCLQQAIAECENLLADQPDHVRLSLRRQIIQLRSCILRMPHHVARNARRLLLSIDYIESCSAKSLGPLSGKIRELCAMISQPRLVAVTDRNFQSQHLHTDTWRLPSEGRRSPAA